MDMCLVMPIFVVSGEGNVYLALCRLPRTRRKPIAIALISALGLLVISACKVDLQMPLLAWVAAVSIPGMQSVDAEKT